VHVASQQTYIGTCILSDVPKPGARKTISCLASFGKDAFAISGSQTDAMHAMLGSLGLKADHAWSNLAPKERAEKVRAIGAANTVVVADPTSDAELMQAGQIGIAIGGRGAALTAPHVHIMLLTLDVASLCVLANVSGRLPRVVGFVSGLSILLSAAGLLLVR
jgi:cation transport ATPase